MKVRALAIVAVALAGAVGTTFAEASDRSDVHFSVSIGQPAFGWAQPVREVRVVRPVVGRLRSRPRRHPEPLRPGLQPALGP